MPLIVLGHEADGLAVALALAHQGFPVHVLDRGVDPRDPQGHRPGPISLSPAATRQLAVLGLLDQIVAHAVFPSRLVHADGVSGATLRRVELGDGVLARFGHPFLLVRRATLRGVLAAACEADDMITVEYGRAASVVEDLGDGVVLVCEDGISYRAEALVGADGPASPVRPLLGGGPALSVPHVRFDAPGPATPGSEVRLWSSPAAHVVSAPVPGGTEVSVVVRVGPHDELHQAATDDLLARALAGLHADVRAVTAGVAGARPSQVHRYYPPLPTGAQHRLTVAGSAAAPMLPHTAYATGLALVDAGALGRAFDRADGRIVDALADYASRRAATWGRQIEEAGDFAALCHADGLVRRMRDRLWAGGPLDAMAAVVGPASADLRDAAAGSAW